MSRKRIVALGDSITQYATQPNGWLNLLMERYVREYDFVNRGFSGYNTKWMLENFAEIEADFKNATLTTILFGSNDCCSNVPQHVSLKQFSRNLKEIIRRVKEAGSESIVLIQTPWVDEFAHLAYANTMYGLTDTTPSRTSANTAKYAEAVSNISKELNVFCIELHDVMKNTEDKSDLLCDGLHLGNGGNAILDDLVGKYIQQNMNPSVQLPDWKDLN